MKPLHFNHRLAVRIVAACGLLALVACRADQSEPAQTRSQTRVVKAFDAIEMNGFATVDIVVGQTRSVSLSGSEQALEGTQIEVEGSTLRIRTDHHWGWTHHQSRLRIRIAVPQLVALRVRGGNEVMLTGLTGARSRLEIEGAARLIATGKVDQLTVVLEGAGLADLSKLIARDVHVTVDGVGKVIVYSQQSLAATMNGIGAIAYLGSPSRVSTRMNGLGTIAQQGHAHTDHTHRHERRREERQRREQAEPQAPIDPKLQPEYDDRLRSDPEPAAEPMGTEVI
jgi:hypothetical protein